MIMGHFGHTYLPMSDVFYTMPIPLVQFLLRYLPTHKLDVLYERSLRSNYILLFRMTVTFWRQSYTQGVNCIKGSAQISRLYWTP